MFGERKKGGNEGLERRRACQRRKRRARKGMKREARGEEGGRRQLTPCRQHPRIPGPTMKSVTLAAFSLSTTFKRQEKSPMLS